MSTSTILITCFIIANVLATEPEVLLKSQIENAKCFAKCLNGVNSEERSLCYEICQLVQDHPATDICRLDSLWRAGPEYSSSCFSLFLLQ